MTDKEQTDIRRLVHCLITAVRKQERHVVAGMITGLTVIDHTLLAETALCEQALLDAIESLLEPKQEQRSIHDDTYF